MQSLPCFGSQWANVEVSCVAFRHFTAQLASAALDLRTIKITKSISSSFSPVGLGPAEGKINAGLCETCPGLLTAVETDT
jgi:hypothetical protein